MDNAATKTDSRTEREVSALIGLTAEQLAEKAGQRLKSEVTDRLEVVSKAVAKGDLTKAIEGLGRAMSALRIAEHLHRLARVANEPRTPHG